MSHHLLLGVEDRTIPLASAVVWEALRDAEKRWPLAYGHRDILDSPGASTLRREILAEQRW